MTLPTIGIPGYAYPPWTEWISGGHTEVIIMNPNSGPAGAVDPGYVAAIAAAHAAGVKVIAYISTGYGPGATAPWYYPGGTVGGVGGKPLGQVVAEIDAYKAQYSNLDGVFLDECSSQCSNTGYYSTIATYARSVGLTWVALNPGTHPPSCYDGIANAVMVQETTPGAYLTGQPTSWELTATSKMWHAVYNASLEDVPLITAHAATLGADLLYVTNDVLDNPWDNPPPPEWWAALLAGTASLAPTTTTVPSMTLAANLTQVVAGQTVTWTVTIRNAASATANFVGRVDSLVPAHVTTRVTSVVVSGSSTYTPEVNNTPQGQLVVPPSSQIVFTVTDTVAGDATGTVDNTVVLSAAGSALITRAVSVPIVAAPTLSQATLTKTPGSSTVAPGATATWTLVIANPVGAPTATGRLVDNPFPPTIAASRAALLVTTGSATFTPDTSGPIGSYSIPPGGTVVWTIHDVIANTCPDQTLTASATIIPTAGTGSAIQVNPTMDVRSPVAAVVLSFQDQPPDPWAGDVVRWTMTLSNPSPSVVEGRIVSWRPPMVSTRSVEAVAKGGGATFTSESTDAVNGVVHLPPGGSVVWVVADRTWTFAPEGAVIAAEVRFIRPSAIAIAVDQVTVHRRTTPPPTPCPCT